MKRSLRRLFNREPTARAEMGEVTAELLAELLRRHAGALELLARQRCDAPADVVQEAFVQLIRQPRLPDNVVGWLYRVVRNGAISAARASTRRRRHESAAAEQSPSWFTEGETPELDPQAVTAALKELPPEQREIVVAHLWGEMSFEQIAGLVGMSASSAHRAYHQALMRLRENLGMPCSHKKNRRTKS
jgi:RNA polymerase sigma factor (sigma-70 family)